MRYLYGKYTGAEIHIHIHLEVRDFFSIHVYRCRARSRQVKRGRLRKRIYCEGAAEIVRLKMRVSF